jgi:hypothetical protein
MEQRAMTRYDAYYQRLAKIQFFLGNYMCFSFARFGDGELGVIDGVDQNRPEWRWVSKDSYYQALREKLIRALQYTHPHYYIGIEPGLVAIVGKQRLQSYYRLSGQKRARILTANLFVNQNYLTFVAKVVPLFRKYRVSVICHETGDVDNLPFAVENHFACHENAWVHDSHLRDEITQHAMARTGCLYLFMAGPLSNILICDLHKLNPGNSYIDIGSPLDPFLFGRNTRGYLRIYNR